MYRAPGVRSIPRPLRLRATYTGGTQAGIHGDFKRVTAQKAGGEEQQFKVLDLAGTGVHTGDHVVAQFFGFLFRVRRTLVYVQYVPCTVVSEGQFRFHMMCFMKG